MDTGLKQESSLREVTLEDIGQRHMNGLKALEEVSTRLQQVVNGVKELLKLDIGLFQLDSGLKVVNQDIGIPKQTNGSKLIQIIVDTFQNQENGVGQLEDIIHMMVNGFQVAEEDITRAQAVGLPLQLPLQPQLQQ